MSDIRLGVDVGGTFTDLVALGEDGLTTVKVPSTPRDQSRGVLDAIRRSGVETHAVQALAHGMTVATNALLERAGARTALITTHGFRDILEIARQHRPSLYDLTMNRPSPLVPRTLRFTVSERMGPDGEIEALDEASVRRAVQGIRAAGEVEAVAVCLLFSFMHPDHERRVSEILAGELPDLHVSLSSDVLPEFREFERFSTTAADAYLGPCLSRYLNNLATQLRETGLPEPLIMQSSGGVMDIADAGRNAAACLLSGPAGGVVGAAHVGGLGGFDNLLTFDMGGTSTDVAPVLDGRAAITTESEIAGVPVKLPMVDVHTVSAGGGSIAWVDAGGALRVGPRSAGAEPGPACYGLGGEVPTVTDANLYLGYLEDGAELGGQVRLDRAAAERALASLGQALNLDALAVARGIVQLADTQMTQALRVISVERGLDPREFALMAFGGAGPLHACALAAELGMRTVLVPRAGGVLSALGLAVSDVRRDYARPVLKRLDQLPEGELDRLFGDMEDTARGALPEAEYERRVDLRYRGQSFELTVNAGPAGNLADGFYEAHERRYGYRMQNQPLEVVTLRLVARRPVTRPELREVPVGRAPRPGHRRVHVEGAWREVPVWMRADLGVGSTLEGPAVVVFAECTCLVAAGWAGEVDAHGTLVLRAMADRH